jgi:hypothetical protein
MATRKLKISGLYRNKKQVPQINLCGKWLKELGYETGTYVVITSDESKIEIRKF